MKDPLEHWCGQVAAMKPGEWLTVDTRALMGIASFEHNGATFTPADRILENIIGSAWTHSYDVDFAGRTVTFRRFEESDTRRYVSPDRRGGSKASGART